MNGARHGKLCSEPACHLLPFHPQKVPSGGVARQIKNRGRDAGQGFSDHKRGCLAPPKEIEVEEIWQWSTLACLAA